MFSENHWAVRAGSLAILFENYKEREELWDWCLGKYKDRETKTWVHDVQSQMQTFEYFVGLRLAILLLRHSVNLSTLLQAKDLCAADAQKISKKIVEILKKMRRNETSETFWKDIQKKQSIYLSILQLRNV